MKTSTSNLYIYSKVLILRPHHNEMVSSSSLMAQQSLPGQRVNGEGLWLNSLDYLPVCYTQHSILTVLYVVCHQSVTSNSNNISGYVYDRVSITQPTPISHSPANSNFESDSWIFVSNSCLLVVLLNNFLAGIICVAFIFKLFVRIS